MKQKYGKFYADWRDPTGRRHAKAFCTIAEALLWKETQRRALTPRGRFATKEERERHYRSYNRRWMNLYNLRRLWTPTAGKTLRRHISNLFRNRMFHSIITSRQLRCPQFTIIDRHGRRHTENWEPPEKLIERLQLHR